MFFHGFEAETWLGLVAVVALYVVGILHVLHALMHVRTSQGTIAWVIFLVTVPVSGDPALLVVRPHPVFAQRRRAAGKGRAPGGAGGIDARAVAANSRWRFRRTMPSNARRAFSAACRSRAATDLELLIDGEETFERIFSAIAEAENYLCVNFFIVKNDTARHAFPAGAHRAGAGRSEGVFPV